MADYRRHIEDGRSRHERDWIDRQDEGRSWFDDRNGRHDTDRGPGDYRDDRTSRWEGAPDDRAFGMYRSDDRDYHDRYRSERGGVHTRPAHNPEDWGVQHLPGNDPSMTPSFGVGRLERGGYWRRYENRLSFQGRGPKGYQRSDDRIREGICDCMTDDPMLDASEIVVDVRQGEVTLSGSVTSREQKRRAEDVAERISGVRDVTNQLRIMREPAGHNWTADSSRASGPGTTSSQPVTEAHEKGTPGKSTSSTTA